jgi:hypothetical protein
MPIYFVSFSAALQEISLLFLYRADADAIRKKKNRAYNRTYLASRSLQLGSI